MKNKPFIISIVGVFIITILMSVIGHLEKFTFFYFIKNNIVYFIICLILLDMLMTYTLMELIKVTVRWAERYYLVKSSKILLISILIVFGFNIWGLIYSLIFKMNLGENLLAVTFNAYVLFFIIYLLFKYLLGRQYNQIKNMKE
jgi:hypothetical protein